MKRRLFFTLLAIAILLLAVGGWTVAAFRAAPLRSTS
jgi:hypothetical protein